MWLSMGKFQVVLRNQTYVVIYSAVPSRVDEPDLCDYLWVYVATYGSIIYVAVYGSITWLPAVNLCTNHP